MGPITMGSSDGVLCICGCHLALETVAVDTVDYLVNVVHLTDLVGTVESVELTC